MIVFIATRGNGYTLQSLAKGTFGVPAPKFRITHYERLFGAWRVPRATYIFGDLERLAPWELRLASDLHRSMAMAGLRCLNDPARAMARVELLTALYNATINPFAVMRADAAPRPRQFPVFIRSESDHAKPQAELYHSQEQLDLALAAIKKSGTPLRGLLVVEQCAERRSDTLWAKWGTWRIGERMIVEHIAVDDSWVVKTGDHDKVTDAIAAEEHDAVSSNCFAPELQRAFDIGGIEFGRGDHAIVRGRMVIYEINTNPYLGPFVPDQRLKRRQAQIIARAGIAEALAQVDTSEGGRIPLPSTPTRRRIRWWRPGFVTPRRP
jgi:hypothetical protein